MLSGLSLIRLHELTFPCLPIGTTASFPVVCKVVKKVFGPVFVMVSLKLLNYLTIYSSAIVILFSLLF
jgi:hypothetical protein